MADTIGVTERAYALATIIAAESLGYLKANTVLAQIVARDWDDEIAQKGQTVRVLKRGALSVNPKAEGSAVTLQYPSDTKVDVTLNKHNEVSFLIEDVAEAMASAKVLPGYVEDGIKVIAEEIDGDIAALYSGLSQTIDASGGLNGATFREARRLLNAAKIPLRDRYAVLHEDAEKEFLGIEEAINKDYSGSLGSGALADAYVGRFAGFTTVLDQKIMVSTTCKNLFIHKNAFVLATRPLPQAPEGLGVIQRTMVEDGIGLRVTMSYNADHLGWQVTIDVLYGVAELMDSAGVCVSTTEAL